MRHLLLLAIFLAFTFLPATGSSQTVTHVLRAQGSCSESVPTCTAFPASISSVCTVSCPLAGRVNPSLANGQQFWGSRDNAANACRRSQDAGQTWGDCTTQPFASTSGPELYAESADGSVIAVGRNAAGTTCQIAKSINNATSWSLVHTFVPGGSCAMGAGDGQRVFCLSNGSCEWILAQSTLTVIFRSSDNGSSWSNETLAGSPVVTGGATIWNGSQGIAPSASTIASTRIPTATGGDTWTNSSANWGGTQGSCWGAVIYNATPYAVCQGAGAAPDARYTLRIGDTGANFASLTLPNALTSSIDAGGIAYGYATNMLYIAATTVSSTYGLYLSIDNLASFTQLGNLTPVGAGIRGGSMFRANGCIYISYGLSTGGIAKVC